MKNERLTLQTVRHPRLSSETTWTALGEIDLLNAATFEPVILSRSTQAAQLKAEAARLETAAQAGTVIVGGFISHPEKAVARRLAHLPELKIIRLLPFTLAHYPLTSFAKKRIAEGKTLILSGFPESEVSLTRPNCVKMNRWILHLCQTEAPITPCSTCCAEPPPPPFTPDISPENDPAAIFL